MERPVSPPSLAALERLVQERPLPRHVGIIMDGNGRWAEMRGQPRVEGHREGSTSVREVTRCARRVGLEALTLYAFSSQNWARPAEEVAALMDLLREYLESERAEILENGIRLNAIGEVDKLPRFVKEPLDRLREDSAHNTGMVLTLALSYGGREELVQAARRVAEAASKGELTPAQLDAKGFESYLWTNGL
ncbi:MAG: polyprenyl diphosphate synthase, partial [Archangium sp.]